MKITHNIFKYILLLFFVSDESLAGSPGSVGMKFENCIIEFGNLMIMENEIPESLCYVPNVLNDVFRSSVSGYASRVSSFQKEARKECFRRWKEDWEQVFLVEATPEFTRFASETVKDPKSKFSDRYYKLFRRAEFERNMTLMIQNRNYPSKSPESDCYSMWMSLIVARADNVGFLLQNGFVEDLQQGKMPAAVYPQFWLIVQHADLHVDFQKDMLNILEQVRPDKAFPKRLIESLRERVEHNIQYLQD